VDILSIKDTGGNVQGSVLVIPNKTEKREEKDDIERESFDYIFESGG